MTALQNVLEPGRLADLVLGNLGLPVPKAQDLLEAADPVDRLRQVGDHLTHEVELLEVQTRIETQAKEELTRTQREYFLREQLKQIQDELGVTDPREREAAELRRKIKDAGLPPQAAQEAESQITRLLTLQPESAESGVVRTYLEWLVELPWAKASRERLDLQQAHEVLDDDHYDLFDVKDRILDHLSVRKLKPDSRGPILCFVGRPASARRPWDAPSPAPWGASSSACRWAACATRPRSAGTAAPTWAPCPGGSCRGCGRAARTTRCSCWMKWTSWARTSGATRRAPCWRCWTRSRTSTSRTTT